MDWEQRPSHYLLRSCASSFISPASTPPWPGTACYRRSPPGPVMLPVAAIAGASERSIMNQTGHRSVQMVRRYIRDGSLFRENSAGKLGL